MERTNDGRLCLQRSELASLKLMHLLSGMDEDDRSAADCGRLTTVSGYTEWISPQSSALTLGWDWQLASDYGHPKVVRLGLPRTNIQVLDDGMSPLPWEASLQVLAEFIDGFEWAPPALQAVSYPM